MSITLSHIRASFGATASKKRVGRGLGSKGTTAGRGQKGQSSRSGVGGLKRKGMRNTVLATPKTRGFKAIAPKAQPVNLGDIADKFIAGETVTPRTLMKKGLVTRADLAVKILAVGDLSHAVNVKGCKLSAVAAEKITKAGGSVNS